MPSQIQRVTRPVFISVAGSEFIDRLNRILAVILGQGGGKLIEKDNSLGIGNEKTIIPSIDKTDLETINKYELTNIRIYAEFNERLYLCYKMKKNIDPLKDLVFDLPIPLEYKEYIDIISS